MLKVKRNDFYDDLNNEGNDPWLDDENEFDEKVNVENEITTHYNSGYENPLRPLIYPPSYSQIDFDIIRVDHYEKYKWTHFGIRQRNFVSECFLDKRWCRCYFKRV